MIFPYTDSLSALAGKSFQAFAAGDYAEITIAAIELVRKGIQFNELTISLTIAAKDNSQKQTGYLLLHYAAVKRYYHSRIAADNRRLQTLTACRAVVNKCSELRLHKNYRLRVGNQRQNRAKKILKAMFDSNEK